MVERRVWIPQGIYNIYPNFFIILIAASGQKKSTPINLVDKLIRRVTEDGPNIVAQKVSPEALIGAIKVTENKNPKKLGAQSCGGIVIADELATFLDRGALDRGLGPVLTKLFDCSPFEYETLKRGSEKIEGGYLSILGGTTVELLRSCLPRDAIGGGFTSRTIFVYEEKISAPVPWIDFDETTLAREQELVSYLQALTQLSGTIRVEPDARAFYEADYNHRYNNNEFRKNSTLSGYESRRAMHLFKVAIAMMLAEEPGLVLKASHMKGAKYILEEAEEHMPRVMELILASDTGAQGNQVFQYIKTLKQVTRSELVRHFNSRLDAVDISKIMDTLIQSGMVKVMTNGQKLIYALNE